MDPHRNLFFFYRGPIDPTSVGIPWDTQLENNTTKAFINLLEYLPPSQAMVPFLNLAIPQLAQAVGQRPLEVSLQRFPEVARRALHRVPVLLCPARAVDSSDSRMGGRPDAFLYTRDGFFAMLIETKTAASYSGDQLAGHLASAGWDRDLTWRHVSWEDTYGFLKRAGVGDSTEQSFIRSQFLQYLELIGMAPFEGFTQDDFDYFVRPNDDYAPILKGKLLKLGQNVFHALPRQLQETYSEGPHLGKMSQRKERRGLWLAIREPQDSKHPLRQSNFTFELDSEGASINAVIRNGRFDQPRTAIGILYAALEEEDRGLLKALAIGSAFSVRVNERVPSDGGVLRGNETWNLRGSIRLDHASEDVFAFLKMMLRAIHLPGIKVRLEIPRWDARLRDGEGLQNLTVETITQVQPLFAALRWSSDHEPR